MPHPLELRLARLRRRARQYLVFSAVARAGALVVASALLLGVVDRLLRLQDRGLRVMLSAALLIALLAGLRRVVQAVRGSRFGDVELAQRIEAVFPTLRGRLASAVAFLREREDDPLAGSVELRRAVVRDVMPAFESADLSTLLDRRALRRAVGQAAAVAALAALLLVADPATSRIAIERQVNPLNAVAWPRANQLAIKQPIERLPAGQTFEVEVIDTRNAPLPDDVVMQYRFTGRDGEVVEESEPAQFVGGMMLARREDVQRPFAYRAVGGDDRAMPWTQLDIVEPPQLRDLSVTLHYPAYTGWAPRSADLNLRAIAGTTVEVHAKSTKPLVAALARLPAETEVPADISADGTTLAISADAAEPFVVQTSGVYSFALEDSEGFHSVNGPKYELRALPDDAPTVEIDHPKGNIFVAADATLPLRITARDDLALRSATLHVLRSDRSDEGETTVALLSRPDEVPPELSAASAAEQYAGDVRSIAHDWALKPLALAPGVQLTFHASAEDYAGHVGQSLARRVSVVTPEEIQDRMADRQSLIFNELNRVLELQRTARTHLAGIELQLDQTGGLTKSDVDALQGAGLNQQQVERELTSERDGLRGQVADFLDELRINNIDGPDTSRQMETVLAELTRLGAGPLPDAARELSAATKAAQVDLPSDAQRAPQPPKASAAKAVRGPLSAAAAAQDEVVASLDRLLSDMKNWVKYRHFHREVGQLARTEEEIAEATAALARETLARSFADLDPQKRADLRKLSARQAELARRLDRLEQQMQDAAAAPQDDPLAAEAVADALAHARTRGVADAMRQAGQNIDQNKMGQASQRQRQVGEDLRDVLDILSNRREHELGRLVKKLREAEAQLSDLAEQERGLRRKLADAKSPDAQSADADATAEAQRTLERLSREQRQLAQQAERFARTLARLQADKARAGVAAAGAKMGRAAERGEQGDGGSAAEQAAAAERDLEEAQKELASDRRQAEVDLAAEQLARIEDDIESLRDRQDALVNETVHYQKQQAARGDLTRAEALSVRDLARQQTALADETHELGKSLVEAAVFQFVLSSVQGDMKTAAERLDRRDVGDETVRFEESARLRLEQLFDAIKSESEQASTKNKADGNGEEGEGGGQQGEQAEPPRSIAELKLLRLLQLQINARTQALDLARKADGRIAPEQEQEFADLRREEGRLADLIADMMPAENKRPEDDPESLPDVRRAPTAAQPSDHPAEGAP